MSMSAEDIDQATRFPLSGLWALLWSNDSLCLHIEKLQDAAYYGMGTLFLVEEPVDYLLIYVGPESAVRAVAKTLQPLVDSRRSTKSLLNGPRAP